MENTKLLVVGKQFEESADQTTVTVFVVDLALKFDAVEFAAEQCQKRGLRYLWCKRADTIVGFDSLTQLSPGSNLHMPSYDAGLAEYEKRCAHECAQQRLEVRDDETALNTLVRRIKMLEQGLSNALEVMGSGFDVSRPGLRTQLAALLSKEVK